MDSSNLQIIIIAELALLLFAVCVFLLMQNRSLRKLISQLKEKAQALMNDLRQAKQKKTPDTQNTKLLSYLDHVEGQLDITLKHHVTLKSARNIALDISKESPLPHRTASLRHALLIAEKEACAQKQENGDIDWRHLRKRYEQIFKFIEDDDDSSANINTEDLDIIKEELTNARKRVKNLEKFKKLYFELEEKFQASKQQAQTQYEDLSSIASSLDTTGELSNALQMYHNSYSSVAEILEKEATSTADSMTTGSANSPNEVQHLRSVAADQHKIIEELQRKLREAVTDSERNGLIEGLQEQLQTQVRFVQESETCIQLLEDELNSVTADLEHMRSRANQVPQIKSEVVNLRKQHDEMELKYHATVSENRKLQKKIKESSSSSSTNTGDSAALRKELNDMEARYNELEEKFLDLKLQS